MPGRQPPERRFAAVVAAVAVPKLVDADGDLVQAIEGLHDRLVPGLVQAKVPAWTAAELAHISRHLGEGSAP
jgi:hypothetical protein